MMTSESCTSKTSSKYYVWDNTESDVESENEDVKDDDWEMTGEVSELGNSDDNSDDEEEEKEVK